MQNGDRFARRTVFGTGFFSDGDAVRRVPRSTGGPLIAPESLPNDGKWSTGSPIRNRRTRTWGPGDVRNREGGLEGSPEPRR